MKLRTGLRNGLVRMLGRFRSPPTSGDGDPVYRFLTYHRIRPRQLVAFRGQLDRLQTHYNLVTPSQFEAGEGSTDQLNLLLTFDDGYLEWESIVLKELEKRDLRAIFFVCPDWVGREGAPAEQYCRDHLKIEPATPVTMSGIDKILARGHTLGNHLLCHRDLRDTPPPGDLRHCFAESQAVFEERLGRRPDWVAYPFADCFTDPDRLGEVASEFFRYGVTLIPGWNRPGQQPRLLHRDGFSPSLSAPVETAWLRGGYDPVFRVTHLFPRWTASNKPPHRPRS